MLSATQTPRLLVIEEKPSGWSAVGTILIVFGAVFGIGTIIRFSDFSWLLLVFWFLLWLFALTAGWLFVIYEPAAKIMIDRKNRQVRLVRRALLGWKRKVLNFDEIKYFHPIENRDAGGASHSLAGLELRRGEVLTIKMLPSHVEEFECRYILEINEFLRKGALHKNTN